MESFFSWSTSHRLRKAPAAIQLWSHSPHFMSFSQIGTGLHSWIQDYSTLRPWSESHLCLLHCSTCSSCVFHKVPQPNSFIYVSQCMLTETPWKRYTPDEHSYYALKAKTQNKREHVETHKEHFPWTICVPWKCSLWFMDQFSHFAFSH